MTIADPARRQRFERLVDQVYEPLQRYARRRTDPTTADDVVADALLALWRRLDDVPPGGELPWAYRTAGHCLANLSRSAARQARLADKLRHLPPPEAEPVGHQPGEADPDLHAALARLPPNDQELLRLWAWEQLAPSEIALVLDVTSNAVSIRLHRAKGKLAKILAETSPDERPARQPDTDPMTEGREVT